MSSKTKHGCFLLDLNGRATYCNISILTSSFHFQLDHIFLNASHHLFFAAADIVIRLRKTNIYGSGTNRLESVFINYFTGIKL